MEIECRGGTKISSRVQGPFFLHTGLGCAKCIEQICQRNLEFLGKRLDVITNVKSSHENSLNSSFCAVTADSQSWQPYENKKRYVGKAQFRGVRGRVGVTIRSLCTCSGSENGMLWRERTDVQSRAPKNTSAATWAVACCGRSPKPPVEGEARGDCFEADTRELKTFLTHTSTRSHYFGIAINAHALTCLTLKSRT